MKPNSSGSVLARASSARGEKMPKAQITIPTNRRPLRFFVLALSLLCVSVMQGQPAFAQTKVEKFKPVAIAIIDVKAVMRSSKAARSIRAQIEAQRAIYQKTFSEREKALREEEKALAQQKAILTQEAFQKRLREFKERVAQAQRDVQQHKRVLDQAFGNSMNKVRDVLIEAVAALAKKTEAGVVLFKNQIVIAEKALDISKPALELLDKNLPDVKVELLPAKSQ